MKVKLDTESGIVVGLGSALVDILARENDDFLNKISSIKGGMTLVDDAFIQDVSGQLTNETVVVPGGAACNTIIGVGKLGGGARFVGKRGSDEMGDVFESDLKENNVVPVLTTSSSPNGKVLSIITPDAQRSMFTFLGAASELSPADITDDCFKGAAIVLIEAYLLYNSPSPVLSAIKAAKKAGALIAMDLSSFTVVEDFKDMINEEIIRDIDILIANEDEARAFTGHSDEKRAIESLSEKAAVAVLKVGKRGSYISYNNTLIRVDPVVAGNVIDTTGAGDLWAAGFLFGIVSGLPLQKCGEIASACGAEVCKVLGAKVPDEGWERIKKVVD